MKGMVRFTGGEITFVLFMGVVFLTLAVTYVFVAWKQHCYSSPSTFQMLP
jgi:cell division protein FtsL